MFLLIDLNPLFQDQNYPPQDIAIVTIQTRALYTILHNATRKYIIIPPKKATLTKEPIHTKHTVTFDKKKLKYKLKYQINHLTSYIQETTTELTFFIRNSLTLRDIQAFLPLEPSDTTTRVCISHLDKRVMTSLVTIQCNDE